jgi:hypothetical protein
MPVTGRYYDLDEGEPIGQAIIREGGNEIAFDMQHSDGHLYSVRLIRNNGHIFTGRAVSNPGNQEAELTCRVYVDLDEGITLIAGSKWMRRGESISYRWQVELVADNG